MNVFSILALILVAVGVILLLDLTPERITDDILSMVTPKQSIRDKARIAQGKKKTRKISKSLLNIQTAMKETGNGGKFTIVCSSSIVFLVAGIILAVVIDNIFLAPVFGVACFLVPFLYARSIINYYEQHIDLELESTLSMITTAYIRTDDIVRAVQENLDYIRPPLNEIFRSFVGETSLINSDIKSSILRLRSKIRNDVFQEWCDVLLQCQDDRTLNDTLYPIVAKLTDIRIVNNEMTTLLRTARLEYYTMAALVVINIPLLYILNKDWYSTLMHTNPGKIVLAICGVVILVTAGFMLKFTKPVKYSR